MVLVFGLEVGSSVKVLDGVIMFFLVDQDGEEVNWVSRVLITFLLVISFVKRVFKHGSVIVGEMVRKCSM